MVSSKVLPIGIEGHGLPFCGQNVRPGLPGPRLPSVQQMNKIPCWIFEEKSGLRLLENRIFGFLLGVPCARFLVCPIINNTITKTVFSVAGPHIRYVRWADGVMENAPPSTF